MNIKLYETTTTAAVAAATALATIENIHLQTLSVSKVHRNTPFFGIIVTTKKLPRKNLSHSLSYSVLQQQQQQKHPFDIFNFCSRPFFHFSFGFAILLLRWICFGIFSQMHPPPPMRWMHFGWIRKWKMAWNQSTFYRNFQWTFCHDSILCHAFERERKRKKSQF